MLCGPGQKLDQAHIGTNQNTIEKRNTKIKLMTETKFKVGDLIESAKSSIPIVMRIPILITSINSKEYPITYTMSSDMKQFFTVYADWIDENMVLCEKLS